MSLEISDFVGCFVGSSSCLEAAIIGFVVGVLVAALKAIFEANAVQTGRFDLSQRKIEVYKCG